MITTIVNKLLGRKAKPVYGPRIFQQRTWLNKQVDDAMYKRTIYKTFGID